MTYRQFLKVLRTKVRGKFRAEIRRSGEIRLHRKARGKLRCFCPITAVCFVETGRLFYTTRYQAAANYADFYGRWFLISDIATAADHPNSSRYDDVSKLRHRNLRRALKNALGLHEPKKRAA
mgnify:FL=1